MAEDRRQGPAGLRVGARVAVESEKVGTPARHGVVTELDPPLVQVRWDDGGESSFVPAAGCMHVE
jgi:hypothetical protein